MKTGLPSVLVLGMCLPAIVAAADAVSAPNVLLIMTDDQGWGDVSSHGNDKIHTPHLDKLAKSGARFDRFFVSPVCAPTRASLLTGRYHLRTNVHGVTRGQENMKSEETTLAEMFQRAGYVTGCFGKWHNGKHYPQHPNGQGFDEFIGFCGGHWNNYFDSPLEHNGQEFISEGYIADLLADSAGRFMAANREKPFFCYVPLNTPHSPWQVPQEYFDRTKNRGLDATTACAYAMCENIDYNIGKLLKLLDDLKLAGNTIVIFLTDNGPNGNRYNGGMRGQKGSVHEGGCRAPLFIRWPGRIEAGLHIQPIAAHIDLLPTLAELCGIEPPNELPLDGRSLAPLLLQTGEAWPDRMIFTQRGKGERGAVRSQQWRAVKEGKQWQLYDMQTDPGQQRDVSKEHPQELKKLSDAYDDLLQEIGPLQLLPIPVGHTERPLVELPGHEAILQGKGIRYFGPSGWANDWVAHWENQQAYPQWNLQVESEGTFEVSLLYSAAEDQVGTKLEISAGESKTTVEIRKPCVAKIIPTPDRIERKETYPRAWGELSAGKIELKRGPAELIVRALARPGKEVIELKAVRLLRVAP